MIRALPLAVVEKHHLAGYEPLQPGAMDRSLAVAARKQSRERERAVQPSRSRLGKCRLQTDHAHGAFVIAGAFESAFGSDFLEAAGIAFRPLDGQSL